jgi:hypothetical protein
MKMHARQGGLATLLLTVGLAASTCPAGAGQAPPTVTLCGWRATPPARWEHVVWIWFENKDFGSVIGPGKAPFINRTLIPSCGLATNYHALAHPSLPNYIAATSGLTGDALRPFADDCDAVGPCRIDAPSIYGQAPSWGTYAQSMRRPCARRLTGDYAARHNPAVYYRELDDCDLHAVNLRMLARDLDADTLPAFATITPNMCRSMHDCSVRAGDAWLRRIVRRLASSAAYQRRTMAIVVTFDEGEGGDNPRPDLHPEPVDRTRGPVERALHALLAASHDRGDARPAAAGARAAGAEHA